MNFKDLIKKASRSEEASDEFEEEIEEIRKLIDEEGSDEGEERIVKLEEEIEEIRKNLAPGQTELGVKKLENRINDLSNTVNELSKENKELKEKISGVDESSDGIEKGNEERIKDIERNIKRISNEIKCLREEVDDINFGEMDIKLLKESYKNIKNRISALEDGDEKDTPDQIVENMDNFTDEIKTAELPTEEDLGHKYEEEEREVRSAFRDVKKSLENIGRNMEGKNRESKKGADNEIPKELRSWIGRGLTKGFGPEKLKESLKKHGRDPSVVDIYMENR